MQPIVEIPSLDETSVVKDHIFFRHIKYADDNIPIESHEWHKLERYEYKFMSHEELNEFQVHNLENMYRRLYPATQGD